VHLYQSISKKENPAAFFFSSHANQSVWHFNISSCLIRYRRSDRKIRHYWKHTTIKALVRQSQKRRLVHNVLTTDRISAKKIKCEQSDLRSISPEKQPRSQ
jgi:hypothetical protein